MKEQDKLRYLAFGGWAWVAFAILAVMVRGVRWEENYEFAQVLLDWISYPDYFPVYQHAHNSLSLQTYLMAFLMRMEPAPWFACGVRDILYLIAKTIPLYLLGAALTRRVSWGHAAALLGLIAGNEFATRYPAAPWPMFTGNGATGAGFALLALACFAWGWHGRAFFLTLLMPAVHIGQAPALAVVAAIYAWKVVRERCPAKSRRAIIGGMAGLAGIVATLAVYLFVRVPLAACPASAESAASSGAIWHSYIEFFPSHRDLVWDQDQVVLAWSFLLSLAILSRVRRGPWFWAACYALVTCGIVWGTMITHWQLGADTPYLLLAWMPYRLVNHLIPLSVALMVGTVAGPVRGTSLFIIAAIGLAAWPVDGEAAYVFLAGAAISAGATQAMNHPRRTALWLTAAAAVWIAMIDAFDLSIEYFAAGMLLAALLPHILDRFHASEKLQLHAPRFAAVAVAVTVALLLHGEWRLRDANPAERLAPTPFESEAARYMTDRGDENALIAAPPYQWRLQARLGHPITVDCATLTWLPYHLELAPTLHIMFRDLFGVDLLNPVRDPDPVCVWRRVWTARSRHEWRMLANRYGFKYVITVPWVPVDLPLALADDTYELHYVE